MTTRTCFTILFTATAIALAACQGPFPSSSKPNVPDDHTDSIKGVLHKAGQDEPYTEESGCAGSDCHKDDLDGGVGDLDGVTVIVPSCFQCHATLWEDEDDELSAMQLYNAIIQTKEEFK